MKKIKSGDMMLEEAKKLPIRFKSNLKEILKERFKLDEQLHELKNIKLLYKAREAAVKLFDDYSLI